MSNLKLYEISDQYQFLLSQLYNDDTGEINNVALEMLQEMKEPMENKCLNVVRVFKALDAEREAIEKERKNMAAREKSLKTQVDFLKNYLLINMEKCEIKKIECPQFVISLKKNPHAVDAYDKSVIPDEYKKITIEYDIQRMKYDMLNNGVVIPGACLIQRNSVQIK